MCGIAGFATLQSEIFSEQDLLSLTHALANRGPDHEGTFYDGRVGLGHRRLSIIDLSSQGNQPFYSQNGQFTAVFNGEIYNYQELRKQLTVQLQSGSDTEVLVELFAQKGPEVLKELNGMFAFAIYDSLAKKLVFARDRVGKKPLYYFLKEGQLVFSSELKSFLEVPLLAKQLSISPEAVAYFLHLGYVPEPYSIYQQIKKFPAGCWGALDLTTGQWEIHPFWKVEEMVGKSVERDELRAKSNLRELLESATAYRMIADVPCGSFLSGGIDSSVVTAVASKVSNERLKTFSIGFKNWDKNEATYAKAVADFLQTDHHELYLSEKEALEWFDGLVDVYDEPFADASAIPSLLVSQFARNSVKVALSGDGGDELFQGYGSYAWAERLSHPMVGVSKSIFKSILDNTQNSRYQRIAELVNFKNRKHLYSHVFSQEQYYFSEPEISKLIKMQGRADFGMVNPSYPLSRKLKPREKQALTDIDTYLKDDLMVKMDRASMRFGLEVRNPLLDFRIIAYSLNLDINLKVRNGKTKYLLKQVLFDMVPEKYFQRPKWGFSIPLNQWLKNELYYLVESYLSEERISEAGMVYPAAVAELLQQWRGGKDYLYNRVWQLIILHRWYFKTHGKIGNR